MAFLRGLAASKPDAAERLASAFRRAGALLAARTLREHGSDLRVVAARKGVDGAMIERFQQKLAITRETFDAKSKQAKSAQANLDAALAARETAP